MATELSFARQFLQTLDSRPIKLSSDHVQDPRTLPPQPAYILPRNAFAFSPPAATTTSSSSTTTSPPTTSQIQPQQTLTLTLKPLRGASTTLPHTSPHSSIYEIKTRLAARTGYDPDKIKVLWERKPVGDVKTLREVLGEEAMQSEEGAGWEMGVMYVGAPVRAPKSEKEVEGAAVAAAAATATAGAAGAAVAAAENAGAAAGGDTVMAEGAGSGGDDANKKVLGSQQFWSDLADWMSEKEFGGDYAFAQRVAGAFWQGYRQSDLHS